MTAMDIVHALKRRKTTLYGFGNEYKAWQREWKSCKVKYDCVKMWITECMSMEWQNGELMLRIKVISDIDIWDAVYKHFYLNIRLVTIKHIYLQEFNIETSNLRNILTA